MRLTPDSLRKLKDEGLISDYLYTYLKEKVYKDCLQRYIS